MHTHHNTPYRTLLKLNKYILLCLLIILGLYLGFSRWQKPTQQKLVAIAQIIEHAALDDVRRGIEDSLKHSALYQQKQLGWSYDNAQGSVSLAVQIAHNIAGETPDVAVAIGTPVAQALYSTLKVQNTPLVFAAITDPIAADLVESLATPPTFMTGVIDAPPVAKQLDLMQSVVPNLKTLGVLYNPGEANSVSTIKELKALAKAEGLTVVEGPVQRPADILQAAKRVFAKVDAVFVPQDNIVVSAMQTVAQLALEAGKPLFAADSGSVENGALATYSYSYYEIGQETGRRILNILAGDSPGSMPISTPPDVKLYINEKTRRSLKLTLPERIQKSVYSTNSP